MLLVVVEPAEDIARPVAEAVAATFEARFPFFGGETETRYRDENVAVLVGLPDRIEAENLTELVAVDLVDIGIEKVRQESGAVKLLDLLSWRSLVRDEGQEVCRLLP